MVQGNNRVDIFNSNNLKKKYLNEKQVSLNQIKNNEFLILDIINMFNDNFDLSIRKISELLKVDRKKINKVLEKANIKKNHCNGMSKVR